MDGDEAMMMAEAMEDAPLMEAAAEEPKKTKTLEELAEEEQGCLCCCCICLRFWLDGVNKMAHGFLSDDPWSKLDWFFFDFDPDDLAMMIDELIVMMCLVVESGVDFLWAHEYSKKWQQVKLKKQLSKFLKWEWDQAQKKKTILHETISWK